MTEIVRSTRIGSPPSAVFAVLRDVRRLPEVSHLTVEVRDAPARPLQVGDRFEQVIRLLGVELSTDWEVTELRTDELLRVVGRTTADGHATLTHSLVRDGAGTSLTMTVAYEPPLGIIGEIADHLVFERRNEQDAEEILGNVRTLCESGTATTRP